MNSEKNNIDMSNVINKLFEGDCLEYMKKIPDGSVDMILCDLPYGMTQNKWDSYIPLDELWKQYNRIIKPNGAIVLTSNGVFTAKLILSQPNIYKYKWVWEKSKPTNFLNAKKQPLRKHEDVCVFYKKQPTYHPQMTKGEPYDKGMRNTKNSLPVQNKSRKLRANSQSWSKNILNVQMHLQTVTAFRLTATVLFQTAVAQQFFRHSTARTLMATI